MRKIVVLTFVSLDGVMQAPGGREEDLSGGFKYGGWTVPYSSPSDNTMNEQMSMPFDLLLGRKTYEIFAAYWPKQKEGVIATSLNNAKKYVVSDSNIDLTWDGSILIKDDVVAKLKALKEQDGPMLQVHGSSVLIQTLLKNDLVDELWLKIFPVTLGKGKRLFGEGAIPAAFELTESKTLPSGVIVANYKRAGAVKTGSFD
ncbi:MAG TPA: dihydrofolate reductase family protein [Candidatus Saccharimonadales bacterium]|nr:dihydrofolate reductase family protein [Candidatus Saccharimonadales bacterium]